MRTTIAQLEAVVTAQGNTIALQEDAIVALSHQLARVEQQLAHLQLGTKAEAIPQVEIDPCSRVTNWRMEYARYRGVTGKSPTADDVRAWIRAGRPGA